MNSKSGPKVIGLGLGRTGTTSLMEALEQLGFGPCYHMKDILRRWDPDEINAWYKQGQGLADLDDLRELLKDYNSILDYPCAIYYDKLYEAYPDAKFILTTRDPAKWEASMNATILNALKKFREFPEPDPFRTAMSQWYAVEMEGRYHQDKIYTDAQGEIVRHNKCVIDTIPAEKLLVYEVGQGWDPLVEFLGVKKPDTPFPYLNKTEEFQARLPQVLKLDAEGSH